MKNTSTSPSPAAHLEKIIQSGALVEAREEKNFLKRAHKWFGLLGDIYKAYDNDRGNNNHTYHNEVHQRRHWPIIASVAVGILSCAAAAASIVAIGTSTLGTIGIFDMVIAGGLGLASGVGLGSIGYLFTDDVIRSAPSRRHAQHHAVIDNNYKMLVHTADHAIDGMEKSLLDQTPDERVEFRNAFKQAALKRDLHAQNEHRIEVERNARNAASSARSARLMSITAIAIAAGR